MPSEAEIQRITGCAGLLITDSRKFRFRFAEMKSPLCAEIVFPAIFFQEGISSFTCRYRRSARKQTRRRILNSETQSANGDALASPFALCANPNIPVHWRMN